ncbi:GNAT family N-acetyltransferase [Pseudoclavibacter alba]|uniref:GNAT family N-acetyltransferase n=1 Tax=Pseudoclavibacter albus TaxID=272241 RepID=A0ABT2HZ73_9MICO|nr:GNAT family N-acetyltransferase [Pseudoclavibacter alba]MCT2043599.1 GNAT family N-acetyltransferase [Pseudoclavibacter alba]
MTTQRRVDEVSRTRLEALDLDYRLVADDDAAIDAWFAACARGFHDVAPEAEDGRREIRRERARAQRVLGVWKASQEGEPIATVCSWPMELTIAPGRSLSMWGISGVTVAPTHSGKGIARAMLEGELRSAAAEGYAIAGLTVSESTLYGRYGFGISAQSSILRFDTTRVNWCGPTPDVELDFITVAEAVEVLQRLHSKQARATRCDVVREATFWRLVTGVETPNDATVRSRRFVLATSPAGDELGIVGYRLDGFDDDDFTKHRLIVDVLVAPDIDGRAALWRYVLSQPLVRSVKTEQLVAPDDPIRWWIGDWRGVQERRTDHHWTRVLDVVRVLEACAYSAPDRLVLEIEDDLGFAEGVYLLDTRDQQPVVTRCDGATPGVAHIKLDVSTLASLVFGCFSAESLGAAAQLEGDDASVRCAGRMFQAGREPFLSTWF